MVQEDCQVPPDQLENADLVVCEDPLVLRAQSENREHQEDEACRDLMDRLDPRVRLVTGA